jgi:RimJ/RimL family protein N-acetyltransferase
MIRIMEQWLRHHSGTSIARLRLSPAEIGARLARRVRNLAPVRWLRSNRYLMVLAIDATDAQPPEANDGLKCNDRRDLALFEQTERWLPPDEFAREAERRMQEGLKVYTAAQDGRLLHYAWLVPLQQTAWLPYVSQHYRFPPATAVMFNDYTHPAARGRGLHTRSMRRRIWDAVHVFGAQRVYVSIETSNAASRAVAQKTGLRCVDVLFETIRFGQVRRGRLSWEDYRSTVESPTR